jgi:hypothetical protein
VSGPIRPGSLQGDGDSPVPQTMESVLPERWPAEILAEPLGPFAIARRQLEEADALEVLLVPRRDAVEQPGRDVDMGRLAYISGSARLASRSSVMP